METCNSDPKVDVLQAKTADRDLQFWSSSRCFASKSHKSGLEPIETSHSDAKVAVLNAQNHR